MAPVFLKGKSIFLGPLSANDNLDEYASWINDQETTAYMGSGRFPASADSLKEYINAYSGSKTGMLLGIFLNSSGEHIGNITLHQIDWVNGLGEVGIIIGSRKARGKGYAEAAIRLIAGHAFNRVNLRKLYAGMIEGNDASKKAFEKVGFKVEGTLRQHFQLNGVCLDCYRLGLLKSDFIEK
jgi:RimJ/RimL family protein N-acetyltransferase